MQDKIYKINRITLDEQNQEFCLSHDHGIKTFSLEDFQEKETSDNFELKLGSIALAQLFPGYDNLVVFIGTQKNTDFPPNNLVFFDIKNKKNIFQKTFNEEITNFKCVSNFIFIAFGKSLIIFYYDKTKNTLEQKEEHEIEKSSLFECWADYQENKLYLAFPLKQELVIYFYTIIEWSYGNRMNIKSPVKTIQNIFYVDKLKQIFISDESAIYIYGFDIDDGKTKLCLKRGDRPGFITSVTLLNEGKFLAINNLDRTIHIFDLDPKNNAFSFMNVVNNYFYGIQELYPKIRIKYKDILENEEGLFYKNDFSEKGAMLYSNNDDELNIVAYNGFAFKIKINFQEASYKSSLKVEYVEKKMKIISIYNSGFEIKSE